MESRKKILIVARWPVGGILTYFSYVYSQACFYQYELIFVMPKFEGGEEFLRDRCQNNKISFVYSEHSNKALYSCCRALLKEEVDLVHSHGYTAGVVTYAALLLNKRVPHLMTAHDVFLRGQFVGWKGWLKKAAMSAAFRRIDAIHAVSEDCKANFLEFFPRTQEKRIHTILHGVDTEKFYNEEPREFQKELGFSNEFLLGFFGRFMAQKGFKYIVEAIELLVAKDGRYRHKLKVLTFGWGGFIREEFEEIERRGLSDIFIQMPHTDNMPAAIKGVDAVLMPSLWEACGLLGMEALSAGTPIVGTNCIGLREVLDGSPAIVIEPKSADEIAVAIEAMVVDSRQSEFQNYAITAKERFALERPANELVSLYREMLGQ